MPKSTQPHEKMLLVEGEEDQRLIPQLVEANGVVWGENEPDWIVSIKPYGGVDNLLKRGIIEAELKGSGLRILGVLLDADDDCEARWETLRNRCLSNFPYLPKDLPQTGLIHENDVGKRFGAWLFPNNKSRGMVETFLSYLVPDAQNNVWNYAKQAAQEAKNHGAGYKPSHADKANIYTWLAWADPPGRQLHDAVIQKILNPTSPLAKPFIDWFKNSMNCR